MYIEKIPQPFLNDLVAGLVAPFVGAGLSQNANPPLPTFGSIARDLAKQIPNYVYNTDPIDTMAAYQQAFSRNQLVQELAARLNPPGVQPADVILAFARLPFELVATTNFDFLLEKAYTILGVPVDPLVTQPQLGLYITLTGVKLFKFHGDFNHPEAIIVTEEDYDSFVSRFPLTATYLAYLLTAYTPFFIGYSLNDYDFRTVLRFVGQNLGGFQRLAYTIQVGASTEDILRFRGRNVYVINYEGNPATDYPRVLKGVFEELLAYWLEHTIKNATVTDPEVREALVCGQTDKLCFIAVPPDKLGEYKTVIAPLAREAGRVPVTAADIWTPRGERAKQMALAESAGKVATEPSSQFAKFFLSRYRPEKVLLVGNPVQAAAAEGSPPHSFAQTIRDWLGKPL